MCRRRVLHINHHQKWIIQNDYTLHFMYFLIINYRAFKQECPTAILDEETFKEVYQKIFPLGESSKYAKLVFNTIDR